MDYEIRTERNRGFKSLRITEIPENTNHRKLKCSYCDTPLSVWMGENGFCHDISTVCKLCKRKLLIDADGRVTEQK